MPVKISKGHLRKREALRKSLGNEIADKAFAEWLKRQEKQDAEPDPHMLKLKIAVTKLVKDGLIIPPSGLKITKSRHGITASKIKMNTKPRKKSLMTSGKPSASTTPTMASTKEPRKKIGKKKK